MYTFLTFIHTANCVLLVVAVLLQSGKGGGLAGAFGGGGSTQAVFGGRGAATFLSRATTVLAIIFMVSSLTLTVMGGNQTRRSIISESAKKEGVAAPFTPAGPPASESDQQLEGSMPSGSATPEAGTPAGTEAPQGTATGNATTTPPQGGAGSPPPQSP